MPSNYDIVFSFDTTGSMSAVIPEVRRGVKEMIDRMFAEIPHVRIGIIAHGDYCDEGKTYLMKSVDLTTDKDALIQFINTVENTNGGDTPEAYEYVLHKAQGFAWTSDSMRALVIIADAYPHSPSESRDHLDWQQEVGELQRMGINIFSVQALYHGNPTAYSFYKQMAEKTNGYHLFLDQFSYIRDILIAVAFKQFNNTKVEELEQELINKLGGLTRSMRNAFDVILKRKTSDAIRDEYAVTYRMPTRRARSSSGSTSAETRTMTFSEAEAGDLRPVPPSKFQVLRVDHETVIKDFVTAHGLTFVKGRGFYEFTKPEIIQANKEVVLMDKTSGDLFEGEAARKMIGLPEGEKVKLRPTDLTKYRVFVQSNSYNRKLMPMTGFLYEVDYDR